MHRRWACLLALGASACSSAEELWSWPEFPPTTHSIVLAAERGPRFELRAEAWSVDAPSAPIELEAAELSRVTLLAYDSTLADLGYEPGPVDLAREGDCGEQSLLPAEAIFERSLDDDAWSPSSSPRAKVQAARALARCPCRALEPVRDLTVDLPGLTKAEVVELDEILYVLSHQGSFRLELTGSSTGTISSPNPMIITTPNTIPTAPEDHWIDGEARIWLAGNTKGAPIVRWDPKTQAESVLIRDAGVRCTGISGAPPELDTELYVACEDGVTERFDGTSWTRIAETPYGEDPEQAGRVAWLGSGRAVTSFHDSRRLGFVRQSRMASVVDRGDVASIETWLTTEAFGTLAGTRLGEVAELDEEQLRPLPRLREDPLSDGPIHQMWEQDGAVLYVTREGHVGQIRPGPVVCVPQAVGGFIKVFGGAGLADRVWLVGSDALGMLRIAELELSDP